ncbi:DUF2796 domain-containing protein [Stenotrophomonas sp. YAU14A_MKIMI4_1]|uniref:ZrgA family zinc uptake protein n=1 Tax=Stenotrophomonas sp. YAU14A_MKIMI4_1 TaxID=2072408 RepID=UPI000D542D27|nr:DUF2796 domain-containing protein [Stenotrophomonas sp. YAU14A_MKIMI4_1]AWH29353.1 DUF2796 domain-containing protein [Stenotrophomonas sp. YAU14A_MKIMI4_1]
MKYTFAFLLLSALPTAHAHDHRQLGAHVHGQANVDLAVDNGALELTLAAPGMGVLDYERPPTNEAERAALQRALTVLREGRWLTLPSAAQCTCIRADAQAEGFQPQTANTANTGSTTHAHAGFTASLAYRCANPAALRVVLVTLPTVFPGLREVIVNTATAAGQGRSIVTPDNLRVVLAP